MGQRVEPADDPPVDDADPAVAQHHHVPGVDVAVEGAPAHRGEEEGPHDLLHQRRGVERRARPPAPDRRWAPRRRTPWSARCGRRTPDRARARPCRVRSNSFCRRRKWTSDRASLRRSISSPICTRKPSSTCSVDPANWSPVRRTRISISGCMRSRSVATTCSMPGRNTLTATTRPSCRRARCTTAIDAVPIGSVSNSAKTPFERAAEVLLHPLAHLGKGDGRPGVEAGPELVGHLVAEHPRRRGDDLPELHEGPAQVLEALAQRAGQLRAGQGALADGAQLPQGDRGEVQAHHLGDGGAAADECGGARFGQPPGVDLRDVLGERPRPRRRRPSPRTVTQRRRPWPRPSVTCSGYATSPDAHPARRCRAGGAGRRVVQEKPASSAASAPL